TIVFPGRICSASPRRGQQKVSLTLTSTPEYLSPLAGLVSQIMPVPQAYAWGYTLPPAQRGLVECSHIQSRLSGVQSFCSLPHSYRSAIGGLGSPAKLL